VQETFTQVTGVPWRSIELENLNDISKGANLIRNAYIEALNAANSFITN